MNGTGTSLGHFTGINWRARNTVTGQVITGATNTFANNADGAQQSITTSFPSRGRWVIEGIAQGAAVSLISLRLTEAELNRLVSLQNSQRTAYSLAVVASTER